MSVSKVIEIIAESPDSVEDAVQRGLEKAACTLDGIKGAWLSETTVVTTGRVTVVDSRISRNTAADGGGIAVTGALGVTRGTVYGNLCLSGK